MQWLVLLQRRQTQWLSLERVLAARKSWLVHVQKLMYHLVATYIRLYYLLHEEH